MVQLDLVIETVKPPPLPLSIGATLPHLRSSVLLLTYNQERFVAESLLSLLEQDITDLEIVVSDDLSSDSTWEVVKLIESQYKGTKTLILNRNERNLGIVGNYSAAFTLSSGDLIFTAAGDDISLSTRCSSSIAHWENFDRKYDLVATDAYDMNLDGSVHSIKQTDNLQNWDLSKWALRRPYIFGASHMMTRRLLNIAPLNHLLPYEDQCLVFRALSISGATRLPLPLVKHRKGGISQQARGYSYAAKMEKLLQSSRDTLVECEQMLEDASILGCPDFIFNKIKQAKATAQYAHDMILSRNWQEKRRLLLRTQGIPLTKKLRYLHLTTFPGFHTSLLRFKHFFKKTSS